MSRLYLSNPCAFLVYPLHTAMRAQSAPGFPCALSDERGNEIAEPGRKPVAGIIFVVPAKRPFFACCASFAGLKSAEALARRRKREPGPITTGLCCYGALEPQRAPTFTPVVMGPCARAQLRTRQGRH